MLLGVKKLKIGSQSPNSEFVLQNLYFCLMCPKTEWSCDISIDRKFYTLLKQKHEKRTNSGPVP
jgi:hypothetical protein